MDRHRSLFKENSSLQSPRQHNRLNRELRGADRKAKREDLRMAGRNISSLTPSPCQPGFSRLTPICAGISARDLALSPEIGSDKENARVEITVESQERTDAPVTQAAGSRLQSGTLRVVKAACSLDSPKLTRQEAYLKRFVAWKQRKQEAVAKQQQRKQKFKPAGAPLNLPTTVKVNAQILSRSFAPKDHEFKAPAGLKSSEEMKKAFTNTLVVAQNLRRSLYTVVPTPPRKTNHNTSKVKKALVGSQSGAVKRKAAAATPSLTHKTPAKMKPLSWTSTPKPGSKGALNGLPNAPAVKPLPKQNKLPKTPSTSSKTTLNVATAKLPVKNGQIAMPNQSAKSKPPAKTFLKPPPPAVPRMPPPLAVKSLKLLSNGGQVKDAPKIGAVGKAKELQQKRLDDVKKHAKLAINFKTNKTGATAGKIARNKDPIKPATKRTHRKIHLNKQIVQGMLEQELCFAETPTYTTSTNTFDDFVTSTKHKEPHASNSAEEFAKLTKTISPVETVITESACGVAVKRNSAKRQILQGGQRAVNMKFNFIQDESANLSVANLTRDVANDRNVTLVPHAVEKVAVAAPISPVRDSAENRPINYLSPYVSVSRGKVSLSAERKKRDSVYLQTPPMCDKPPTDSETQTPVEVRRTLETVRYFRLQVSNEISRLNSLCDTWDLYKDTNLACLDGTDGVDMINMTIGQTKLLINKKFKQFTGLIDRCEAEAKGQGAVCDGGEDTKPVTAVDLEGFWSMVGLQIENVGKRFDNLNKWKTNNWHDPDERVEVKVKPVKAKKPRAATAKNTGTSNAKGPSSLQQMLRKLHAETRKKKNETSINKAEPVPTTPIRQLRPRQSMSPVIVQDKKSRSPVPTRVFVRSPASRSLLERSRGSDLLKAALHGAQQKDRKSFLAPPQPPAASLECSPVRSPARKSILKTPGTLKRTTKSVIFNDTPQVKRFNFVLDEDDSNEKNESTDGTPRMYRLRNRNIKLRPEDEIEIPFQ